MISFVEAVLAYEMREKPRPGHERLHKHVEEDPEIYYYNAVKNLDHYRYRAEIEYLKKIILED